MTGPPVDGAQSEAEVNGKYDNAGVTPARKDGKPILHIIETQIYQPRTAN